MVSEVEEGSFDGFDKWMRQHDAPLGEDLLPYGDICGSQDVDLSTARSEKARARRRKMVQSASPGNPDVDAEPEKTRLSTEAKAILEEFPSNQFFFADGVYGFAQPGGLDLFSRKFGVAKMMVKYCAPWVLTFAWCRPAAADLLAPKLRERTLHMIKLGCFLSMGAAPIC